MDKRKLYAIAFINEHHIVAAGEEADLDKYYVLSHNKSNATILAKATRIQAGLHTKVDSCEEVEVIIG